ncbi:hypothetical protein HHK36_022901 [Tetracentron sinense]|uniref:Glutaredoxin domain-containing protein n=1 Tax=Tetracentron sinense TaxID=13715 RepID=A0A834YVQ4_TETSI|nr:hypothetical protein HHK36_022901 [Tetracentron sinense]
MERVRILASQKPVVIFSKSTCCMCHTIKALFSELGVYPAFHELDQVPNGREMERELLSLGQNPAVPAVFIGGELAGGANEVMALHINGSLIPWLIRVRAIWVSTLPGVTSLVSQKPVVIFSKSTSCMCHAVKAVFRNLGRDPAIHELDEDPRGREIDWAFLRLDCNPVVPAVFIHGDRVGGWC